MDTGENGAGHLWNEIDEPKGVDEVLDIVDEAIVGVHEGEDAGGDHGHPEDDIHADAEVHRPDENGDVGHNEPDKHPGESAHPNENKGRLELSGNALNGRNR